MISLTVNGKDYSLDVDPEVPLLWVIRERLKLTGTKYGCGIEQCGACTVHIDGRAERSCQVSVGEAQGKRIRTIEGLGDDHPIQRAWIELDVPQCGYCQSGQVMAAAALLDQKPKPTDSDIDEAMSGIICRCGTYQRIRRAIQLAAETMARGGTS